MIFLPEKYIVETKARYLPPGSKLQIYYKVKKRFFMFWYMPYDEEFLLISDAKKFIAKKLSKGKSK